MALHGFLLFALTTPEALARQPVPARPDAPAATTAASAKTPAHAVPTAWVPECGSAAWRGAAVTEALQPVLRRARSLQAEGVPPWDEAAYTEFSRNGRREAGERMLLGRQQPLAAWTLAECHEGQGRWLPALTELLDGLAAQPAWTLPAHDRALHNLRGRPSVDLNACELAHDLAWSLRLLGDRLPPRTQQAVAQAMERRIFQPLRVALARRAAGQPLLAHWWLESPTNWNAVCLGGVTGAALVLPHADAELWRAQAPALVDAYLRSVQDDGYSDEGPSYWTYGFGQYLRLRETLLAAGAHDIAAAPKALALARYPARIEIGGGLAALFGDARPGVGPHPVVRAHAEAVLGRLDAAAWQAVARSQLTGLRLNEAVWRLWGTPGAALRESAAAAERCTLFPDSGVAVVRPKPGQPGGLAASFRLGGSQSHAHDDAGSYAITQGAVYIAGDLGMPTYAGDTFGPKRRENPLINSWGHPVPLVGGARQRDATKFRAAWERAPCSDTDPDRESAVINLRDVYDVPALSRLQRRLSYSRRPGEGMLVMDTLQAREPLRFESAFVSHAVPEMGERSFVVRRDGQALRVFISASGPWEWVQDRVTSDPHNHFSRVAVRLKQPVRDGCIAWQMLPVSTGEKVEAATVPDTCAVAR